MSVPLNFKASYLKTNLLCYWDVFLYHLLSDFDEYGVISKWQMYCLLWCLQEDWDHEEVHGILLNVKKHALFHYQQWHTQNSVRGKLCNTCCSVTLLHAHNCYCTASLLYKPPFPVRARWLAKAVKKRKIKERREIQANEIRVDAENGCGGEDKDPHPLLLSSTSHIHHFYPCSGLSHTASMSCKHHKKKVSRRQGRILREITRALISGNKSLITCK